MARNTYRDDPNFLFELHFALYCKECGPSRVTIRAWEHGFEGPNHTRIDCQLLWNGKEVFPRGSMWAGVPSHQSIDGDAAKELATSLFCMKPGDTDAEFFANYTPEQIEWVNAHAETLSLEKVSRFGEEC